MLAQPSFGGEMLEEGMEAGRPFVFPAGDGKAAGDRLLPVGGVGKACAAARRLFEDAGRPIFE
jgi:hypothetical protein